MKGLIITTFVFFFFCLLSGIVSAVLFCLGMDAYAAIGMISTIISILLGIISMAIPMFPEKKRRYYLKSLETKLKT